LASESVSLLAWVLASPLVWVFESPWVWPSAGALLLPSVSALGTPESPPVPEPGSQLARESVPASVGGLGTPRVQVLTSAILQQ